MSNDVYFSDECSERTSSHVNPIDPTTQVGEPLESGLRIIADQTTSPRAKAGLLKLIRLLEQGVPRSKALSETADELPSAIRMVVETGIETGQWNSVIQCAIDQSKRGDSLRKQIWLLLSYRIILCWMGLFFCGLFLIVIVPEYSRLYAYGGVKIGGFSSCLVRLSALITYKLFHFEAWRWVLFGGGIINFVYLVALCSRCVQSRASSFPLLGRAFRDAAMSDLCQHLANLLEAGLPLTKSLQIASHSSDDCWLKNTCQSIIRVIQQGSPTTVAVSKDELPISLFLAFPGDCTVAEYVQSLRGLSEMYACRCSVDYVKWCWLLGLGTVLGITFFMASSVFNTINSLFLSHASF